ncbi:Dbl homology domain-containing protein [Gaertneriomyces semiglobifer]|nr:Dbl homology domain-containing protein [Gaertneriomyces semiglobifer]
MRCSPTLETFWHSMKGERNEHLTACSKSQQLGKAFLDGAPFLRMYSVYYNNFDSANNLVRGLDSNAPATTSSALGASPGVSGPGSFARLRILVAESAANKAMSKRFREFMHEVRNHPRHTQNSLQSFLILPVQRLPRYKLLLDELFECTPSDHPDYEPLKQAREEVRCRVQECNEKKREWEAREQGLHVLLKVKIRDWSARAAVVNHVKPGRRFIRDGLVRVVKCLEPAGLVEEDEQRIDPLMACGGKRDRFRQIFIGGLVETRFGFKGSSLEDGDTIGPEQLITHGLTRTTGKEFKLFLFSDVLCWCKRKGTADGEFDLVCGVELGTDDMAVELIESDQGGGPANIEFGAFLRIRNAQSIVYLGGTVAEMSSWYAAIMDGR